MTAPLAWHIDANFISEMMRPRPEPQTATYLNSVAGLCLTPITVWEILGGIGSLAPGSGRRGLAERLQDLDDELIEDHIFDWTLADPRACARISDSKRRHGKAFDNYLPVSSATLGSRQSIPEPMSVSDVRCCRPFWRYMPTCPPRHLWCGGTLIRRFRSSARSSEVGS